MRYDFEWDPTKVRTNVGKRGVPFELTLSVVAHPLAVTKPDPRYEDS